jgi:hypothetical protein
MTPGRRTLVLLAAAVVALIGCGGTTDDRPPRWSFISATITEPSCATVNCHSEIAKRAGVDLHDRTTGFNELTMKGFVDPMSPDDSAVLFLMRAQGSLRMPPDMPLPEADIVLIRNWIAAGATNN